MAHFAELDETNTVLRVLVVDNSVILVDGQESEAAGVAFLQSLFGPSNWKQTSYNGKFRVNYAGIGFKYDEALDAFIPPSPYPSWILDTEHFIWMAPVPYPTDGQRYSWDEPSLSWVLVQPQDP